MSVDFLGDGYQVTLRRMATPERSRLDRLLRRKRPYWETVFVGVPVSGIWRRNLGGGDTLGVEAQDLLSYLATHKP